MSANSGLVTATYQGDQCWPPVAIISVRLMQPNFNTVEFIVVTKQPSSRIVVSWLKVAMIVPVIIQYLWVNNMS